GGGVLAPHLAGTIVSGSAGTGLTLYANSLCMTAGEVFGTANAEAPMLGNDVMVGGHSGVFGHVTVGDRVQLGPKVQLAENVTPDAQVWSTMARGSVKECDSRPAASTPRVPSRGLSPNVRWHDTKTRMARDRAHRMPIASGRSYPFF